MQRPPNPQMRLKDKAFRHLRMAAKGAALGSRRLLKKAGENFAETKPRGRPRSRESQPNGRECQRGLPRRGRPRSRKSQPNGCE